MRENYSFPDFLVYCASSNESMRVEGEIFWQNRIPMPAVLVKRIFFSADHFLPIYLKHLLSAVILGLYELSEKLESGLIERYPDPIITEGQRNSEFLRGVWEVSQRLQQYKSFELSVSERSGLGPIKLTFSEFEKCLRHKGKRYDRLYYPDSIRRELQEYFPKVTGLIRRKNGDFFGNVIADELNIYRAGFGDALSALFKCFLDFKFDNFPFLDPREASRGQVEAVSAVAEGRLRYVDYAEGYLWDPLLQSRGGIGAQIDRNHPIFDLPDNQQITVLLLALASEEMSIFDEDTKTAIENFRFRVSATSRRLSQGKDSKWPVN